MKTQTQTQTVGALAASLPRVNLLPPEVDERRRFQRLTVALALVLVVTACGTGAFYFHDKSSVTGAQQAVTVATSEHTRLIAKLAKLSDVGTVNAQLATSEATLTQAMTSEVLWSQQLADLSTMIPSGIWLTKLTIRQNAATPTPGAAQASGTVGTIELDGYGRSGHIATADWLDALAKDPVYADATFTTSQEISLYNQIVAKFASSVTVVDGALSNRCAKPGVC